MGTGGRRMRSQHGRADELTGEGGHTPADDGAALLQRARLFASLYGAGGALGVGTVLLLPHWPGLNPAGVLVTSFAALAGCGFLAGFGRRLPTWSFHVMVQLGTVL